MPVYKVTMQYNATADFYVEAEDKDQIDAFMEAHPDWDPKDVPGLVENSDETEEGFVVRPSKFTSCFRITPELELEEK